MKIRNIPYGYKYENGKIVIDVVAQNVILDICHTYLIGESMLQISERLNRIGVEYREGVIGWNKARIKRIIEDERYLGSKGFPRLIDDITSATMRQIQADKNTRAHTVIQDDEQIDVPIICPICHSEMRRMYDGRIKNKTRWVCKNSDCKTYISKGDAELRQDIVAILNELLSDPDSIQNVSANYNLPSQRQQLLYDEIQRMFGGFEIDKELLHKKLMEYASVYYSECDSGNSATKRLRDILASTPIAEKFSPELLYSTTDEIALHTDGAIELKLINGQCVRRT